MSLCLICLRTDTILKIASVTLQEFHEGLLILSDVSTVTLPSPCYYCNECGYLLAKFCKFKQKCVKSRKIYDTWKSTVMRKKQPLNVLHTLLPPSSLSTWNNFDKMAVITVQAPNTRTLSVDTKSMNNTNIQEKQECNLTDNINYVNKIRNENICKNDSKSEQLDEIKNCTENVEQILSDKFGELSGDEAELMNDNGNDSSTTSGIYKDKTENAENNDEEKQELLLTLEELSGDNVVEIMNDDDSNIILIVKDEIDNSSKETKILNDDSSESYVSLKKSHCKEESLQMKAEYYDEVKKNDTNYESVFDIEYLTTLEMKWDEFDRRKTYECYVKAEHKCEICYQTFKSLKFLEYHINKSHTERPGLVCCPICNIWSTNASTHKILHTVVFKCKLCPLVTYHRESMQNHHDWHKGKQYHCEECDTTYKSYSAYHTHLGKIHRQGRNVCEACGRGFRSPAGLQIHKTTSGRCTVSEEITEGVRCEECDVTLPSLEVYEVHMSDVHKQKRIKRVFTKSSPKRYPGPAREICRLCYAECRGWWHLQQHFRKDHPSDKITVVYSDRAKQLCDICGIGFCHVYSLRDHMNKHTGERPYACDLCPKGFRSALLRNAHRLRHFPSTYSCSYCGKQFKSNGNLYVHMKTHVGEKDHVCDICGKGFFQRANLTEHVQGVHYNIRRKRRGADGGIAKRRTTVLENDDDRDEPFE